jgi:hypothetical protein
MGIARASPNAWLSGDAAVAVVSDDFSQEDADRVVAEITRARGLAATWMQAA